MWSPFLDDLAGRTIVFDWPGMGRSTVRFRPQTPKRSSAGSVTVESMCSVTPSAARSRFTSPQPGPDLVRRLVLVAATLGWGSAIGEPMAMASLATPLRYYSPAYLMWTSRFTGAGTYETDPEYLARSAAVRQRYRPDVRAYYGQLLALTSSSVVPHLSGIQQPTLVVHGASDPVVPAANGYLLAHRITEARLLLVANAGHMLLQCRIPGLASAVSGCLGADDHRSSAWADARDITAGQMCHAVRRTDWRAAQPMG